MTEKHMGNLKKARKALKQNKNKEHAEKYKVKVEQMKNNKGNIVMNHFIIYVNNGIFFQSYDSIIAFKSNEGKIFLDENDWNYSRTTGKYRNNFLNEGIEETRDKIKKGIYNLTNLN